MIGRLRTGLESQRALRVLGAIAPGGPARSVTVAGGNRRKFEGVHGRRRFRTLLKDPVLDHFQVAVHVEHVGFVAHGPDPNCEVRAGGIMAIEEHEP